MTHRGPFQPRRFCDSVIPTATAPLTDLTSRLVTTGTVAIAAETRSAATAAEPARFGSAALRTAKLPALSAKPSAAAVHPPGTNHPAEPTLQRGRLGSTRNSQQLPG